MNIFSITKKENGCDYHRIIQPLKYMDITESPIEKADIVIFNRYSGKDISRLLSLKKRYGFKIVCDLDDFWELYPNHIYSSHWRASGMKQSIMESLYNSDMVFVTTNRLAEVVKDFNKNIEVIPNGLPFGYEQFTNYKERTDKLELLYTSGSSHFWDLLELKNLFYKIAREPLRKEMTFSLAGYSDKNDNDKKLWTSMESIMTANNRLEYKRKGSLPLEEYMNHYNTASIAIAPLQNNYFNRFKSNLKIIEAGCKNIPIITAKSPPYSDELSPVSCLEASTVKEWYESIEKLIKNPTYREELGLKLGEYVRTHYDLIKINEKRKQIFEYLCH